MLAFGLSDDPELDYERYCRLEEEHDKNLPVCSICDETIYEEKALCIEDDWICEKCIKDNMRPVQW